MFGIIYILICMNLSEHHINFNFPLADFQKQLLPFFLNDCKEYIADPWTD